MVPVDKQSFQWFQNSRQRLLDAAKILAAVGTERNNSQLDDAARTLVGKLESFYFNVVILGEFKRGKSTLVNAIIGQQVLPTATIPLTSVTTVVRYGSKPRLHVTLDGRPRLDLKIEEIEQYVTERGNPGNKLGVRFVEVYFPSDILQDGVRIIDTPGTGSIHQHNTETTYKFLPEADAGIFVLSADQPASRSELDLMHEARKFAKRLFFVQNKIDYLDEKSKKESLSFLKETLEKELSEPCIVYPISAKQALEAKTSSEMDAQKLSNSGFMSFESALYQFLANEKAKTFLDSISSRICSLALEAKQLIQLEQELAGLPAATLEDCLTRFRIAGREILKQQSDAEYIVRGEIGVVIDCVAEDLKPIITAHTSLLRKFTAEAYERNKDLEKDQLIYTLRQTLKERIGQILTAWREDEDRKIAASFELLTKRFVDRANDIIDDIRRLTHQLFNTEVTTQFEVEPLTDKSRLYFVVDDPFTFAIQTIPLMLPAPIAKRLIYSRFLESAESELSRNATLLRADYQERIEASTRNFLINFRERIIEALQQIESVVEKAIELRNDEQSDQKLINERLQSKMSTIEQALRLAQLDTDCA